jgi:NhaP-type Na+/H+ or K+/H+ antiporter
VDKCGRIKILEFNYSTVPLYVVEKESIIFVATIMVLITIIRQGLVLPVVIKKNSAS